MSAQTIPCGPFDLHAPVGSGGMAEVWQATHRAQQVQAAVKVITSSQPTSGSYRTSLRREVQAEARLDHPGIVTIFDYGRTSEATARASEGHLAADSPYIAMELAEVGTLAGDFRVDTWRDLRMLLLALLDALAYAHARGVIHRDIKPANVLVGRPRRSPDPAAVSFKLTDFGIAHAMTPETPEGMETAKIFAKSAGTPHFMAPEQIEERWRDFGPWTDLYALGCLTFQLVCGRPPFVADSPLDIAAQHLEAAPPRLNPRFPTPGGLEAWVRRLLAKGSQARFRRAADAAAALARLPRHIEEAPEGAEIPAEANPTARTLPHPDEDSEDPADEDAPRPESAQQPSAGIEETTDLGPLGAWRARRDDAPAEAEASNARLDTETTLPNQGERTITDTLEPGRLNADEHDPAETLQPHGSGADGPERHVPVVSRLTSIGTLGSYDDDIFSASRFQPPPPLPANWHFDVPAPPEDPLVGAGLTLFGLREVPFVDREAARDLGWNQLREVFQQHGARTAIFRGPTGAGKSRLARWLCRRGHEVGAVTVLRASHQPRSGPSESLGRLLESHFATWRLDRRRTYQRIRRRLQQTPAPGDSTPEADLLEDDARALTEILRPSADKSADTEGPGYRFVSVDERHAVITRLLRRIGQERPLAVWLDDVQWADETLALVEHVHEQDPDLPVLFLLTVDDDALAGDTAGARTLDRLADRPSVATRTLEPMPPEEHRLLVHRMLPMEADLVDRVTDRTAGHPLFAVQLVDDWVERGVLEVGEAGFRLRPDAEAPLPDDIHELWERRLEHLYATLAPDRQRETQRALTIAACLGRDVDGREWERVCRQADLAPPGELVDAMIDRGLATRLDYGWAFAHGMLRESLERTAREHGWGRANHGACAAMLGQLYDPRALGVGERLADHLVAADRPEEAVDPLLWAARAHKEIGEIREARRLLERRQAIMDDLDIPQDARARVEGWLIRASLLKGLGRPEAASQQLQRALPPARRAGWDDLLAEGHRIRGNTAGHAGHFDTAIEEFRTALDHTDPEDSPRTYGSILHDSGRIHRDQGEFERALNLLQDAAELFETAGEDARRATVLEKIGYIHLQTDRADEAQQYLTRALNILEEAEVGNSVAMASTHNTLGDAARQTGEPGRAVHHYQRARQLIERCDMGGYRHSVALNIGLARLELSDWSAAASILAESAEHLRAAEKTPKWIIAQCGLAVCDAAAADWPSWATRFEEVEAFLEDRDFAARDLAAAAEQAGALASAHQRSDFARRCWRLAREHWERLGNTERASRITEKLDNLSG